MANYKNAIPIVVRSEGGVSKDPTDTASRWPVPDGTGNHTNKGVTWQTFSSLAGKLGYVATPALFYAMPQNIWEKIFKNQYWDKIGGDALKSDAVAILLADWSFGSGSYAVKNLQQVLNRTPFNKGLVVDGGIGPKTIAAANSVNQWQLLDKLQAERIDFINQIIANNPTQARFRNGWMDDALHTFNEAKKYVTVFAIGTLAFLTASFFFS